MNWLTQIPIAHRGLHDNLAPENSLLAVDQAITAGFAIEIDVHLSADQQVMVFHDTTLSRMTGRAGRLADHTADALQQMPLLNSTAHIPTLAQVLTSIQGQVPLLIEIKNKGQVGPLEQAIAEQLDQYPGAFALQSFNPYSMGWFAKHRPNWLRGQLSCDFRDEQDMAWWKKLLLRHLLLNSVSKPHFIGYDVRCLPAWAVKRARKRHLPVLAWTVNSSEKQQHANKFADNIIFEGLTDPWLKT